MRFDAATLGYVEDALSECFNYHKALDRYLIRSGVPGEMLKAARDRAELIASNSSNREYDRAPKRFVVQEVLSDLDSAGAEGTRIVSAIVTGLTSGNFPDASASALAAIEGLKNKQKSDAFEARRIREEKELLRSQQRATEERKRTDALLKREQARVILHERFLSLMTEGNAQARGYLLESFLNDLFELEGLDPRSSFKLKGEQIDGSFSWRSRTNLVEAKWVKSPIAGAEFGAFIYKIEGKTADTRGIYISINGCSVEALKGLNSKGSLKFICIDGAHVMRVVAGGERLPELMEKLWRHADETGEAYLPNNKIA
ncbi:MULTISPECIES: hypothetical protein [unclassified Sphingobium]|uniref:hypothetical protein n=1 Tax=unclassified Sphingobium TaxID=2611147 RepID=UPI002224392A|nr:MULTISPECIES: hypothetical protein [unclassified Sphingobium]MCW2351409.1 hypothetical protein [Sphingobium sp. B12D2B]MCW2370630.1 hypothetical protein [Sphingobium sp. B11D3D]